MATTYPSTKQTFTNPTSTDPQNNPSHSSQHATANDTIAAIEDKVGTGASTPTSGKLLRGTGTGTSAWDKDAPTGTIVGDTDTQTLTNKTLTAPVIRSYDGWIDANETPTYSSVDTDTGVLTVASGAASKFPMGCRVSFDQTQALSYYWTFNTNSTADVGSATMSNVGTPTYTAGKFSNALTLNGTNQALSITDASGFKPTGEFTIGAWVKTSNTASYTLIFQSFSQNTSFAGFYITTVQTTGMVQVVVGNNTGTTAGSNYSSLTSKTNVCDGNYHYIVVTFRNNYLQIYVDGKLEAYDYCLTPAYAATNYVRIGCYNTTGSNSLWFNGQIDDLFIINGYALDEETIRQKYLAGTAQGTSDITISKKGIVHDLTDTTLTLFTGRDYTLTNSAITNFKYSTQKSPLGFLAREDKWRVYFTNAVQGGQATPTASTWYNMYSLVIPKGKWLAKYSTTSGVYKVTTATSVMAICTLSTANNSESNYLLSSLNQMEAGSATLAIYANFTSEEIISVATKTTYYLNMMTSTSSATGFVYTLGRPTIIKAVSSYL